jgi:hypothetical protein
MPDVLGDLISLRKQLVHQVDHDLKHFMCSMTCGPLGLSAVAICGRITN